jgi:hypothetical protein
VESTIRQLRLAIVGNQDFLSVVAANQSLGFDDDDAPAASAAPAPAGSKPTSSPAHFSKVISTLHQIVRDWSEEGSAERERAYKPILDELAVRIPITDENRCPRSAE